MTRLVNGKSLSRVGALQINNSNIIYEVIDDDSLATASANNLSTAESTKAYIDAGGSSGYINRTGTVLSPINPGDDFDLDAGISSAGIFELKETAIAAADHSGFGRLYAKDDGTLHFVANGIDTELGGVTTSSLKTVLEITQTIAADTNFSVIASGTGYTKSGDNGDLKISAAAFYDDNDIIIYKDGLWQEKSDDVIWVNSQTFRLSGIVDAGTVLYIFS